MNKIVYDGFIEVICGPMFAGKTAELIHRLDKIKYAKQNAIIFKPIIDTRDNNNIFSRHYKVNNFNIDSPIIMVNNSENILNYIDENSKVIIIDEAQFFDDKIIEVCLFLVQKKKHLIIAGLDKNFRVEPFGPMPKLLAIADKITKLTAACNVCGGHASLTQRIKKSDNEILIGDNDFYEARCYDHYEWDKRKV